MAAIFISHSTADDDAASELATWLQREGFADYYLDHDVDRGTIGGDRWRDTITRTAGSCRCVLFLVSKAWLSGEWSWSEFLLAKTLGKRLITLVLEDFDTTLAPAAADDAAERRIRQALRARLDSMLIEHQGIFLHADPAAWEKLRVALRGAGLDPQVFRPDPATRPTPFPGLASFGDDDADAAIFYGREREIGEVLDELRAMRAVVDRRPLVILGASGAGKSSLLKAGVIPRLRREAPAWLALRAFRPGGAPLLNFSDALARTLADFGVAAVAGSVRAELLDVWRRAERGADGALADRGRQALVDALRTYAERLRDAASRPKATILVSVDQAEEIARADGQDAEALADYLRVAMDAEGGWRLAFSIRTDAFPDLQRHPRFSNLNARGYDLRALPVFRFSDVVEQPAARYGVSVDPALVDALMEDAPQADSLPLLAFALQRLWAQFAASGALKVESYRSMGGLAGLIEDGAERALAGVEPESRDTAPSQPSPRRLALAERTFVPRLASIDSNRRTRGRPARLVDFDEDERELLARFERWRLVSMRQVGDDLQVQVAHESVLREWPRLRHWLEPERERLEALHDLEEAVRWWSRGGRARSDLAHTGRRLASALQLRRHERYGVHFAALPELDGYLRECRIESGRRTSLVWLLVAIAAIIPLFVAITMIAGALGVGPGTDSRFLPVALQVGVAAWMSAIGFVAVYSFVRHYARSLRDPYLILGGAVFTLFFVAATGDFIQRAAPPGLLWRLAQGVVTGAVSGLFFGGLAMHLSRLLFEAVKRLPKFFAAQGRVHGRAPPADGRAATAAPGQEGGAPRP